MLRPWSSRNTIKIIATTSRTWIKPPSVKEVRSPNAQRISKMTINAHIYFHHLSIYILYLLHILAFLILVVPVIISSGKYLVKAISTREVWLVSPAMA